MRNNHTKHSNFGLDRGDGSLRMHLGLGKGRHRFVLERIRTAGILDDTGNITLGPTRRMFFGQYYN